MIGNIFRLFASARPALSEAGPRDVAAIAALHASSFHRGWSDHEIERLLIDRNVLTHRVIVRAALAGFAMSRIVSGEAEILSIAVAPRRRNRGLGFRLLDLHLQKLAGFGVHTVFLEVDETNAPARALYRRAGFREAGRREAYYPRETGRPAAALVLRLDLP